MCRFLASFSLLAAPFIVSAQTPGNFAELVDVFLELIGLLIPVVFGLAVLVFMWGLMKAWILNGGSETEVQKGKQIALWGVIAFTVMVGIWGILAILQATFFG